MWQNENLIPTPRSSDFLDYQQGYNNADTSFSFWFIFNNYIIALILQVYTWHIFFSQEWWWKENVFWTYSGRTSGKSKVLCFLLWRPGTETWTCSTFHFIYLQKFSSTIFQFKLPTLNMNLMEHIRLNVKTKSKVESGDC